MASKTCALKLMLKFFKMLYLAYDSCTLCFWMIL